MTVAINDFYRGDTKKYTISIVDKDDTPVCVNGGKLTFTIKQSQNDSDVDALLQISEIGVDDCNNPQGIIQIVVPASETNNLPTQKLYYDFQYISPSGDVSTLIAGKVKVLVDITRTS